MIVRSGAKPNGRLIEVELAEDDLWPDGAGPISLGDKWKHMTKTADILLIEYMVRNEDMGKEYGEQRIQEIQNG